ncbi:MAG: hypothetical protein KDI02_19235 [Anaerolineae bacterium]|nr:hypothetical protein [Anaerolineae bacterium]MCB0225831.1 hypothetical protein [Anaerolineae bacterium]
MTPSANFTEVWLRLMGDAMRGTADAQRAIRSLGEAPTSPDQMTRWLTQFMPGMSAGTTPAAMEDWLEDSWRMMGVVPRYRYLELLERHELLRTRLEKAEKEIRNLRKTTFAGDVPKQEAQKVLDFWENMLQETIQMQSGWIRSWTDNAVDEQIKSASESDSSDEGTSQKPKSE